MVRLICVHKGKEGLSVVSYHSVYMITCSPCKPPAHMHSSNVFNQKYSLPEPFFPLPASWRGERSPRAMGGAGGAEGPAALPDAGAGLGVTFAKMPCMRMGENGETNMLPGVRPHVCVCQRSPVCIWMRWGNNQCFFQSQFPAKKKNCAQLIFWPGYVKQ